ncbi:MAG: cyclic nucleotide-binding domain-containing protein [Deltaproteobacteria bacterium]|nr:cyclic nucleotide-binding domain-containing protein [Deltaproteobacteria bacterium]
MNSNPKLRHFLQSVPVLAGLEGRSLESVIKVLKRQAFAPDAVICAEGELGRTMFLVEQGEVEVLRTNKVGRPVPIVRLGRGECFGEMALVELEARSANVEARGRTVTYSLNNFDLYQLFKEDNFAFTIVLQNVCRLLSRRLRKADSRIAEFLSGQQASRLAPKPTTAKSRKAVKTTAKPTPKRARRS